MLELRGLADRLRSMLKRILGASRGRRPEPVLLATDRALVAESPGDGKVEIAWDAITAVGAFKKDELTTDLVCVEIEFAEPGTRHEDGRGSVLLIHEQMPGFDEVMRRMEGLPDFQANWRSAVCREPFATDSVTIFRRALQQSPP